MLLATVFNINSGVALSPGMILYISLFIAIFPVLAIMGDTADPDLMDRPPRDPSIPVFNRTTGIRWVIIGAVLAVTALIPLVWGPDDPQVDGPSIAMTMTFAISSLATVGIGVVARRDPGGFWNGPVVPYFVWLGAAAVITVLGVELPFLQRLLDTLPLSGSQWLGVLALSLAAPALMSAEKAWRRRRLTNRNQETHSGVEADSSRPETINA
jgi:Ca2+-transporting ATPase